MSPSHFLSVPKQAIALQQEAERLFEREMHYDNESNPTVDIYDIFIYPSLKFEYY